MSEIGALTVIIERVEKMQNEDQRDTSVTVTLGFIFFFVFYDFLFLR
jgi:hypothetical protein